MATYNIHGPEELRAWAFGKDLAHVIKGIKQRHNSPCRVDIQITVTDRIGRDIWKYRDSAKVEKI